MNNPADQNIHPPFPQQPLRQRAPFMPPMPPRPMTRRARWGQQLMAGQALISNSLPEWFATYAFATYMVALLGINMMYSNYATEWYYWLFGVAWVAGFFYLSVKYSKEWSVQKIRKPKVFEKKLFQTGLWIRVVYAVFIHFFYIAMTGRPLEFDAADSEGYQEMAQDMAIYLSEGNLWPFLTKMAKTSFSDMGFPLFMLLPS